MPQAVLMNDTSGRGHHGCDRVMRVLREALAARGIDILHSHRVTEDWSQDPAFLDALSRADIVVINGEGTIHHGRENGRKLLEIVDHPARGDTPVALVNALYQENPADWGRYLDRIAILSARDRQSATAMAATTSTQVHHVPDLSLAQAGPQASSRNEITVGDSVLAEVRHALARLAIRLSARYLPVNRLRAERVPWMRFGWPARWAVFNVYNHMLALRQPPVTVALSEAAYLDALNRSTCHVTGRFHSMCMCMVTETPFIAIRSNSWKIEVLMEEAGLDPARLMDLDTLASAPPSAFEQPYSEQELASLRAFLTESRANAAAVFDRIAAAAGAAG